MTEVRVPAAILARLPAGAETADFLRAVSGEALSALGAAWTPELVAWFFTKGYDAIPALTLLPEVVPTHDPALERARAQWGAAACLWAGVALLLLGGLASLLVMRFYVGVSDLASVPLWIYLAGWALLPVLPVLVFLASPDAAQRGGSGLDPEAFGFLLLVLLPSLLTLAGFALIARSKRRSAWLALLGVFGLLFRAGKVEP